MFICSYIVRTKIKITYFMKIPSIYCKNKLYISNHKSHEFILKEHFEHSLCTFYILYNHLSSAKAF